MLTLTGLGKTVILFRYIQVPFHYHMRKDNIINEL